MREKADSELVRRQNRRIVLETLRQQGPLARIGLGRHIGLSPASITSISSQLIEDGIVEERHDAALLPEPHKRGRPQTLLDLDPEATAVVAAKISIDGLELALANYRGDILERSASRIATYEARSEDFGNAVAVEIAAFLKRARLKPQQVSRIGFAIQGVADSRSGTIMWSPAFRARNIPLVRPVQQALGISCTIANDANMIAEGLGRRDPGETTAVVFMGYGIGMGLIIDGRVYHGPRGAAAEFGHMNHVPGGPLCRCGRHGCIEAYAADYGILRSAGGGGDVLPPAQSAVPAETMQRLENLARDGDQATLSAYARAGEAIGYGLARLIALLNPTRIVLAGPGIRAMALIESHIMRSIEEGVVDELRRNVEIETVPIDTDMIIKGTIESTLRHLDTHVFAAGPIGPGSIQLEEAV